MKVQELQPTVATDPLQRPIPWISKSPRAWTIALMATVIGIYTLSLSSQWFIGHDSGLYLCLGQNLAYGKGYTLGGEPSAHVPPGFPLILAGLIRAGADMTGMNIVMGILGVACIAVAYWLLRQLVHHDWATLLSFPIALSAEMVQRSGEILSDIPFMLLILGALTLYLRGLRARKPSQSGWEVASVLLVAACWLRVPGFPLAVGAAAALLIASWRTQRVRAILNFAIVIGGVLATLAIFYPAYATVASSGGATYAGVIHREASSFWGRWLLAPLVHFYDSAGQISRLLLSPALRLPAPLSLLLLVLPIGVAMFRRMRRRDIVAPLAILCYYGALCVFLTEVRTRYMLPLLPLLLLYLIEGYQFLLGRLAALRERPGGASGVLRRLKPEHVLAVPYVLAGVIIICNLPLVGRLAWEKRMPNFAWAQQHGVWQDQYRAASDFLATAPREGSVLADYPAAYLANRQCPGLSSATLSRTPTDEQIERLMQRYRVAYFVFDPQEKDPSSHGAKKDSLEIAINRYLSERSQPVYSSGKVRVYEIVPGRKTATATATATASSPSTTAAN